MKILKIQALRGPNIWSVSRKKLIQMRLDLEDLEQKPTNLIDGFRDRIEKMFPTMIEHRCSEGERGGFFTELIVVHGWGMLLNTSLWKFKPLREWMLDMGEPEKPKPPGFIM